MTFRWNSLRAKVVLPILAGFTLVTGMLVYVLFTTSHEVSRKYYAFVGRQQGDEVRRILETAFGDLVTARLLDNPMVAEAKRSATLGEVKAFLRANGLQGIVVERSGTVLLSTIPGPLRKRVLPLAQSEGPFHFQDGLYHYNGYVLEFPAWNWNVLILREPVAWAVEAYRSEFGFLIPSAAALGLGLFGFTLLVVARNFQRPVDRILADLNAKREVGATGIAELDTIGEGINESFRQEKRLYEQLLRSQKLEALGTLAGGVAHDFNNILTAVHGYAEMLADSPSDPETTVRYARTIRDAAAQGADLTRRILSTTRKDRMETGPVDLNDIVRSALRLLERSLPKSIEVVVSLAEGLPPVRGDASHLQQAVLNLALNARDAMPEGGRLAISTARCDGEELPPGDRLDTGEGYVRLSLSDTGCGMDAETRQKVFDPFFTTKESGKGTGLGLFVVHSVVDNHGGSISLYSEPGEGTRVSIWLPATRAAEPSAEPSAEPAREEVPTGSGTILVIDDEAPILELCEDLLGSLGYSTIVARNGAEGLARFDENRDGISLVLLDLIMPKMGGEAVFRELKARKPGVRVLISSGYSPDGYDGIDALLREGAAGFVSKPFSRKAIGHAIRDAIAREKGASAPA